MNKYSESSSLVVMSCCIAHIEHILCMIEMLGMFGIRQFSCLSLAASLMGKCSLSASESDSSPLQPGSPEFC